MTYAPRVPAEVYEVVVDRFRIGGNRTSAQKLGDEVYARPNMVSHHGDGDAALADSRIHHGGDLAGVTESLPHLASLGVTGLCLTSIFKATRADKDGVQDYLTLDPAFGDEDAFKNLVTAAAGHKISIILDGIFPYVGVDHPWFVSALQHTADDESRLDPRDRTRGFFYFDGGSGPDDYATYHDEQDHPELNLHSHELRRRMFTGERSVVHAWLQRGAMGWRLSRADELGYNVLREIVLNARTGGEATFVIGDVRGWADRFVKDGLLDGVANRFLREALIAWLQGQVPAAQLARILMEQVQRYGRDALNRSWTFLSSHDTKRVAAALKGDMERVRLAVSLMYALPGAATIFYGEEVGLGGRNPAHSHLPFDWDESRWDKELLNHHRHLGRLKQEVPALHKGDVVDLTPPGDQDVLAFARVRRDPRETVLAVFNRAYRPQQRLLFIPVTDLPDGLPMRDLMGGEPAVVRAGTLAVEIPQCGARLYVPDESRLPRFFRNL